MGTRRATEFRIAMERIVDFMGSCGEGPREELDLLFHPSRTSVRTGLRLEPALSLNSPPIILSFKPLHSPLMSFVTGQALSVVRIQIYSPNPGNPPFFLAHLRSPVRHGLLLGPRGPRHPPPSSEKVCPSLKSIQTQYCTHTTKAATAIAEIVDKRPADLWMTNDDRGNRQVQ